MSATHSLNSTASVAPVLYVAFELSDGQWKMASTTARGQQARLVTVRARDTHAVLREIPRAGARFGLPGCAAGQFRRAKGSGGWHLVRPVLS
jgi:hypothetical protein